MIKGNNEVGALRHFLSDFRQDCHPSWWKFRWIAWIGENWGDEIVTKFGDTLGDDFVTYCFTQYGDFFGELPEMVRIEVTKMSPNLVTILVTILSLITSPNMVIYLGNCLKWWELRWRKCHQIWWQILWRFCHFLFHPLWWFLGGSAGIGDN